MLWLIFFLSSTKRNHISSANALKLFFLELYLEVSTYQKAQNSAIKKLTQTYHQLARQRREFMMSQIYVHTHTDTVAMEFHGN